MPIRVQRPARGGEGVARLPEPACAEFPRRIARYDLDVGIDDWRAFLSALRACGVYDQTPISLKHIKMQVDQNLLSQKTIC